MNESNVDKPRDEQHPSSPNTDVQKEPLEVKVIGNGSSRALSTAILTALITAVLTALGTSLVVKYQISGEHSRWKIQRRIAYQQRTLDEQIKLLRELVESFTHLQRTRNELNQTFVFFTGVELAARRGHTVDDIHALEKGLQEIVAKHTDQMATLQGHFRYARTIFGDEVSTVIDRCNAYFQSSDYIYTNSEARELEALIDQNLDKTKDIKAELRLFARRYGKPKGHELFTLHAKAILDGMQDEMKKSRANLFEEVLR